MNQISTTWWIVSQIWLNISNFSDYFLRIFKVIWSSVLTIQFTPPQESDKYPRSVGVAFFNSGVPYLDGGSKGVIRVMGDFPL